MKWTEHPNRRKRPRAPSKGRGPIQRAIRRAFVARAIQWRSSAMRECPRGTKTWPLRWPS
jgi:hypothetical protein